jgi:hypothetical protein
MGDLTDPTDLDGPVMGDLTDPIDPDDLTDPTDLADRVMAGQADPDDPDDPDGPVDPAVQSGWTSRTVVGGTTGPSTPDTNTVDTITSFGAVAVSSW